MKRLICFTAIFKNEAANVRETLESVRSIADAWCVLDTGSVDGTQDIVREVMAGIPGELHEESFVDFAVSRNRCLELAGDSAEFMLSLSGDERLYEGAALRSYLEEQRDQPHGAYTVEIRSGGGTRWIYPRILRASAGWRYVGSIHEVPMGPPPALERTGPTVPRASIVHTATDPARKFQRMREFDLPRLEARVATVADPEELAQAIWFLAQTHEALAAEHDLSVPGGPGQAHMLQAMALYRKRAEIGSDQIHASYSLLCSLRVADQISRHIGTSGIYTHEEFLARLDIVKAMNPRLPEAHYFAALHAAYIDARRGLYLAQEAAKVARRAVEAIEARDQTFYLPTDPRMEWMSLKVAADCAHELKNIEYARYLAAQGVKAGGPPELFQEYLVAPEAKSA